MRNILCSVLVLLCVSVNLYAEKVGQISQYGITWTFSEEHESGQFANGDYWVVGPVSVIKIDPPSVEQLGTTSLTGFELGGSNAQPRTMNGSQLNPVTPKGGTTQGFDSAMYIWHPVKGAMYPGRYSADLNVALGVSTEHPLELAPDSSLVSSISYPAGGRPQLKAAAILTVLGAVPPDRGATVFRPPYAGKSKPLYSTKTLRKDLLLNLPLVSSVPDMAKVIDEFQRPWLDHFGFVGDGVQYASPKDNMPNYGREYSMAVGRAALMLLLDEKALTEKFGQNKDALLIRFVQVGIDLHYITENGGYWWGLGGLNHGRKWPILFAGLMLDNERMKTIGSRSKEMPFWGFAEDGQTKYITQEEVDLTHSPKWKPDRRAKQFVPYEKSDIGTPEWCVGGFGPGLTPSDSNASFDVPYRVVNGMSYPSLVLPALLMGQKATWNHDALFDYTDRYVAWALKENPDWRENQRSLYVYGGEFQRVMWEKYRSTAAEVTQE